MELESAGKIYVIFGSTTGTFMQTVVDQLGDGSANNLTGTGTNEQIVSGAGDDTLIGNGGNDVLYGGSGNDIFILNSSNITGLADNNNASSDIMIIDGGNGIDTLKLDGTGITLDFTAISGNKVIDIEKIDITGNGDNTLKLIYTDLLHLNDNNKLYVIGDTGDIVDLTGYVSSEEAIVDNIVYNSYNIGGTSDPDIWIQASMSVIWYVAHILLSTRLCLGR